MTGSFGDRERYLEVRIGGVRRALPLDRLHGVAAPARLLRLPSPPPGLCGAVPFRGQVVPVVEAGAAPAGDAGGPSPLVFLRRSGEVIALRVDAVLGLRGGGGTERLDPDTLPTAPPRPPREAAAAMHRAEPRPSPRLPGLLLRIGGRPFWLGADQALEVLQVAEPTPVPWADPLLPALLLHGGEPVAVARLDLLLGTGAVPNGPWLVCQAGAERLAFRIDDVPTLAGRGDAPSLDLPGLLRSLSGDVAQARPPAPQPEAASRAYMAFELQGQLCLLPLEQVRSVSAAVRLVTLPGASAALGGARAVRGRGTAGGRPAAVAGPRRHVAVAGPPGSGCRRRARLRAGDPARRLGRPGPDGRDREGDGRRDRGRARAARPPGLAARWGRAAARGAGCAVIRILIVDDVTFMRLALRRMLEAEPDMQVVGEARTGAEAVALARELRPDAITMDIEMPGMDGLDATSAIVASVSPTPVIIMVSATTQDGAEHTVEALRRGAKDFVSKSSLFAETDLAHIDTSLRRVLRAWTAKRQAPGLRTRPGTGPLAQRAADLVVVGASTGGPQALGVLLRACGRIEAPIVIALHMPRFFTGSLATMLAADTGLDVREAVAEEVLAPGSVRIIPGGQHGTTVRGIAGFRIRLAPAKEELAPSADRLFASAAQVAAAPVAILLTGMGRDGCEGAAAVHARQGAVLVQSPEECVVAGMAEAAIKAGVATAVLPLSGIAAWLNAPLPAAR